MINDIIRRYSIMKKRKKRLAKIIKTSSGRGYINLRTSKLFTPPIEDYWSDYHVTTAYIGVTSHNQFFTYRKSSGMISECAIISRHEAIDLAYRFNINAILKLHNITLEEY